MSDFEYTQGVDADGPVLLKDGQRVGLDELLEDISALQETVGDLLTALTALVHGFESYENVDPLLADARAAIAKASA
jgi:hypothetical protein